MAEPPVEQEGGQRGPLVLIRPPKAGCFRPRAMRLGYEKTVSGERKESSALGMRVQTATIHRDNS